MKKNLEKQKEWQYLKNNNFWQDQLGNFIIFFCNLRKNNHRDLIFQNIYIYHHLIDILLLTC